MARAPGCLGAVGVAARAVLVGAGHATLLVAPVVGAPPVLELGWLHGVKGLASLGPFLGAVGGTPGQEIILEYSWVLGSTAST